MTHKRQTSIRVSVDTRDRLREMVVELVQMVERGTLDLGGLQLERINPRAMELSMDDAIRLLLNRRDQHKERAIAARSKRKQKGK